MAFGTMPPALPSGSVYPESHLMYSTQLDRVESGGLRGGVYSMRRSTTTLSCQEGIDSVFIVGASARAGTANTITIEASKPAMIVFRITALFR